MRTLSFILAFVLACAGLVGSHGSAHGEARRSIRIGYAISLSGSNKAGAEITLLPNYRMWVAEVNAAGGIWLSHLGKRLPIEVIEYDDHSSAEGAMRGVDRLINDDKVDFILAPWGTGLNLAVLPQLGAAGYPDIVSTALVDRASELNKRWPNSFWLLGTGSDTVEALIHVLERLRGQGKIGNRVAMMNIADQFGIDLSKSARTAFRKANFELAYDRPYPVGMTDMRPALAEVVAANVDAFIAFSYPPDTMLLTEQSIALGFNPKVFFTAVGTAFPLFRNTFGANAEGIMGIGGWNGDASASQRYLERQVAMTGQEPDRWASPVAYVGLQMLQQAIERVGEIDRAAVTKELHTGTFQTILGPVKFENNFRKDIFRIGQWQGGEFFGIDPDTLAGARDAEVPKPAWSPK